MFFLNELSIACTSVSTLIDFIKNKCGVIWTFNRNTIIDLIKVF